LGMFVVIGENLEARCLALKASLVILERLDPQLSQTVGRDQGVAALVAINGQGSRLLWCNAEGVGTVAKPGDADARMYPVDGRHILAPTLSDQSRKSRETPSSRNNSFSSQ